MKSTLLLTMLVAFAAAAPIAHAPSTASDNTSLNASDDTPAPAIPSTTASTPSVTFDDKASKSSSSPSKGSSSASAGGSKAAGHSGNTANTAGSSTAAAAASKGSSTAAAAGSKSSSTAAAAGGTKTTNKGASASGNSAATNSQAAAAWMKDTGVVSNFLNTAASLTGSAFTSAASTALAAEKNELVHKAVLDKDPKVTAAAGVSQANDLLVTQGHFQDVINGLQDMVTNGPSVAAKDVSTINANRCKNVLPSINAYLKAAGTNLQSVVPTACQ